MNMKKLITLLTTGAAALILAGCATSGTSPAGSDARV